MKKFKIGDNVEIKKAHKDQGDGTFIWLDSMTDTVGLISEIIDVELMYSRLAINGFWYPNSVLELVNPNDKLTTFINSKKNELVTDPDILKLKSTKKDIEISFPCK